MANKLPGSKPPSRDGISQSARPNVLWAQLNGFIDRDELTREPEESKAKGLSGAM